MTVHIYIYLNNTIVNWLNAMGGTYFIECNSDAKDIWQFCIERETWISAALILEKKHTQANRESRVFIDNNRPISRLCKWSRTGGQNNNKKWCLAPKGLNFLCFVLQLRYIFTDMKRVYRWNCLARHISTSYKNLVEPPFDSFVSKLNAQVSCCASWRPDPDETYVDNFSITRETIFLCFSPI